MKRKFARIRICKRGMTEKHPNQHIDGDLMCTNKIYNEAITFVVNWKPDKEIKQFVDLYCPDYINKIINNNIEVSIYYPIDITDLIIYLESESILKLDSVSKRNIIKNKDIKKLSLMYRRDKNVIG